ncbi:leucyl/phenylalanyl-tRNA--protein transferase [Inquilinus limosus]|uniref:leucyl/phenylalanyl-tRNA--protein transferase n=1 Tax=Inquilinus limosus TaxID=171674 RepID=UPI003F16E2D9
MTRVTPQLLLRAYAAGLFPMAESADSQELHWFDPPRRGVLPLDGLHVPRRLARTVKAGRFRVTADQAFAAVIAGCAASTPDRPNTWINDEIVGLYTTLHRAGFAHSIECWDGDTLAGGLYGVALGGAFFGESMFSRATDASKVALVHLVARLRAAGFILLDTQFVTDHLARFGTVEIERAEYRRRLEAALALRPDWAGTDPATELDRLLHQRRGEP